MSRYLGPIHKKSKKLNFSILENNQEFKKRKTFAKENKWKRKTEFGLQLKEKQKLKYLYHLGEKQLRNIFKKTLKKRGIQNENLVIQLEKRLDNTVYRLGFSATRKEARQMVNHGHILVNNKKINIPSYLVKVNDVFTIKKDKIKQSPKFQENLKNHQKFPFLEVDMKNIAGKMIKEPQFKELELKINTSLIVEYYNRFT